MSDSARSVPDWLASLISRAKIEDGQPPFSDQALVDFRSGARELVALEEVAAALVAPGEAEFVVDPDARGRGSGTALLETLLSRSGAEAQGAGSSPRAPGLLLWAHGDHPAARALAASHHLTPVRQLLHLSTALELPTSVGLSGENPTHVGNSGIAAFRTGIDEDAWIALNSLIFVDHAEQGSVSRADVDELETESWFDPASFLLLWRENTLIGYCWLKIEGDAGEFYVVGVHPDHQGERLGSLLFEAGLDRMRALGVRRAHLYVEGDNEQALRLYRSRGFEQDSIDTQYAAVLS
jgi:mycothiol synthase